MLPFLLAALPLAPAPWQESLTHFDAAQVFLGPTDPRIRATLDFDGDGRLDALGMALDYGSSPDRTTLRLYRNTGNAQFQPVWSKTIVLDVSGNVAFAVGDIDGDGLDDFAVGISDRIYPFLSRPSGIPVEMPLLEPGGSFNRELVIGDVNGDGRGDLVGLSGTRLLVVLAPPAPAVRPQHGTASIGGFVPWSELQTILTIPTEYPNSYEELALYRGADGLADAAVHRTGEVRLLPIHGGTPTLGAVFPLSFSNTTQSFAGGDVDGDGDGDLVVFHTLNGSGYEVLRQEAGVFHLEPVLGGGPATDLFDVDGDGDLDGVCCGGDGGGPQTYTSASMWEIALNDGNGVFAPSFKIPGLAGSGWAGAGDLDGDGDIDLIAGRSIYFARGALAPRFEVGNLGELVDVDGDGDLDSGLTTTPQCCGLAPGFRTLANDGSGRATLTSLPTFALPAGYTQPNDQGLGDWDGDGDPDLLVSWWSGVVGLFRTTLFRNVAGTLHGDLEVFPVGPHPFDSGQSRRLALDVDRDGDLDLVRSRIASSTNNVSVYWNDGNGGFSPGEPLMDEIVLGLADLDDDGIEDVLAGTASGLGWRRLLPAGGLGPYVAFPLANRPLRALGVGDLDGDGDLDLATTVDGDQPLLLENDGGGGFTPHPGFLPTVSFPDNTVVDVGFLALDVDADGDQDLVMRPYPSAGSCHQVWLNQGGLSFSPRPAQSVVGSSIGDIDLDGDQDLVGSAWYENLAIQGGAGGANQQYGQGVQGAGSIVPVLGAAGSLDVGGTARITLSGAVGGGTSVFLRIGNAPDLLVGYPTPGHTGLVTLEDSTILMLPCMGPAGSGEGRCEYAFGVPAGLAGMTFYYQALVADPDGPGGMSASNALRVTYGLP